MKHKIFFFGLAILTLACSRQKDIPKDFGFLIEDEFSIINTFDSSYTRKYLGGDTVINLELSNRELILIFEVYEKNDLNSLPKTFSFSCYNYEIPSFDTKLRIQSEKQIYTWKYNSNCKKDFLKFLTRYRISKIERFIKAVKSILNNREEILGLPESNLIFK